MLDGAYGGEQAAQGEEDGKALMADVRSMSPQRPVEQQRVREPLYEAPNDRSAPLPAASFDAAALERVAASRVKDTKQATEEMGLNRVEPAIEHKQQHKLEVDEETTRTSGVKTTEASQSDPPKTAMPGGPAGNYVDSDEVFTASKADVRSIVPVEVEQKYLRIGDKYYHPKNRDVVAFEDKGNKLETRSNSEQVAETMVTIARARGWDEIKVSGTETFRKEVWLEAAAHGMHVKGYTPNEVDKAELAKRTRDIDTNKIEPDTKQRFRARETEPDAAAIPPVSLKQAMENVRSAHELQADADRQQADQPAKDRAQAFAQKAPAEAVKDHPELAGTYAAMTSMEKKAQADNLTPQQQAVVSARIRQNIVNSIERGELPQMQVREQTEVKRKVKEEREISR